MTAGTAVSHQRRRSVAGLPVALVVPGILVFVLFVAFPLYEVIKASLQSPGDYKQVLTSSVYLSALIRSLVSSSLASVGMLILAYPVALFMVFGRSPRKRLIVLAVLAPMFLSGVVRVYALELLFVRNGPFDKAFHLTLLFSQTGVIVALVNIFLPFMILSLAGSIGGIDRRLVTAAYSLGSNSFTVIRRIIVPQSVSGIVGGCLVTFALCFSTFLVPVLIGGVQYETLVEVLYQDVVVLFNMNLAATVSVLVLAVAGIAFGLARIVTRGRGVVGQ